MRADVPLLPLTIEFRQHPLDPLRFSLRWLLSLVAISGTFFFLLGEALRLGHATNYHVMKAVEVAKDQSTSYDPMSMSRWHSAMAEKYRAAWGRLDLLLFVFIITIGIVFVLGVLGRVIAWIRPIHERSVSTGE
jgi:hypothetical protein